MIAPYESDAQLAYMFRSGIVDLVATEDSDLVVYGVGKLMFKLQTNG